MNNEQLTTLFDPKQIAVFGASPNKNKVNGKAIKYLNNYKYAGKIYPINPNYEEVQGIKCYSNIKQVPGDVEMAIVSVRASSVMDILKDCHEKGVRVAIIFSSGFREVGTEDGNKLQKQLEQFIEKTGMIICGPNTIGLFHKSNGVTPTFTVALGREVNTITNSIGFASQSGAFGVMIYALLAEMGHDFKFFIDTGNEADIDLSDVLSFMLNKVEVNVISAYIEGIRCGDKFTELIQKSVHVGKPLALLKVGKSELGQQAASSHTGSIAGSDDVYDAVVRQYGAIRVDTVDELKDFLTLAVMDKMPKGNRIGIITISGGAGVLIADQCEELGLRTPSLSNETVAELQTVLPSFGTFNNPVDTTVQLVNDPKMLESCLAIIASDDNVDSIVIFLGLLDGSEEEIIDTLKTFNEKTDKLLTVIWLAAADGIIRKLHSHQIPSFEDPTSAIRSIAQLTHFSLFREKQLKDREHAAKEHKINKIRQQKAIEFITKVRQLNYSTLTEVQSKKLFALYDLPVDDIYLAEHADEAVQFARELNYPVVIKIESPDIQHKTDIDGIRIELNNDEQVRKAFSEIMNNAQKYKPSARILGVSVQRMLEPSIEVIIGTNNDPIFGHMAMIGLGGIFVEVMKDVSLRKFPVTRTDVLEMIDELESKEIFYGVRGAEQLDLDILTETMEKLSELITEIGDEIESIDINPAFIYPKGQGMHFVDGLIVLNK